MNRLAKLAETRILWISLAATVFITIAFQVLVGRYSLILLDSISNPEEVREAVTTMSASQRSLHAWLTATLDVAYPVAYGALFIGSAHAFFPRAAHLVALTALLLMGTDLAEGVVQVLALTETADFIEAKTVLTPVKSLLFVAGLLMTVCGWIKWVAGRFIGRGNSDR